MGKEGSSNISERSAPWFPPFTLDEVQAVLFWSFLDNKKPKGSHKLQRKTSIQETKVCNLKLLLKH